MSLWDSIGTTYVDAAATALPLHRAALFFLGFVGSLAVHHQTHLSIFESIANFPLVAMTSLSSGPLARATLADVMAAAVVIVCSWLYSRTSLRFIFALASRSTDLMNRVRDAQAKAQPDTRQPFEERSKAVELIESSLLETRARLKSMGASAELIGGLGIAAIAASYWGNALDFFLGFFLISIALLLHFSAVRLFLSEYFGPALFKAGLQGKEPPSPTAL